MEVPFVGLVCQCITWELNVMKQFPIRRGFKWVLAATGFALSLLLGPQLAFAQSGSKPTAKKPAAA
jgi:hypothetical protein